MWRKHTKKINAFISSQKLFSILLSSLLLITSCAEDDDNPLDVDISNIEVSIHTHNISAELLANDGSESGVQRLLNGWKNDFPEFATAYTKYVILAGDINDPMLPANFSAFLSDELTKEALLAIEKNAPHNKTLQTQLNEAFRYLKYHFGDENPPIIFLSYNSFNYGVFPDENSLIIGLEMYLGKDHPLTRELPFHEYIKIRMQPEHTVVDAMRAWLEHKIMPPSSANDFLGHLIHEGKLMYLLEATMPKLPKHQIARFTSEEFGWCLSNELNVWKEIVDQKMLYSKDELLVTKFMNDAPFTAGLPKDSPPRVGQWLGWMMIRDYMRKNSEVTIPQLLLEQDNQKILSAYRPDQERKH